MNNEKPLNIILFKYALEHILIIHRMITQPKGHGLLIGMAGTGRKSYARLSSYIAGF